MGASGLYYEGLTEVPTKKQELSFASFFFFAISLIIF